MSTISASTTTTTAYKVTADTTGALTFQSGSGPTTAMTIDSSQNVGIGTSSPSGRFDCQNNQNAISRFYFRNTNAGSSAATFIDLGNDVSAAAGEIWVNSSTNTGLIGGANALVISNLQAAPLVFSTNNGEKARIDSSGNLLVGTATQATGALLTVNGSIKGVITSGTAVASTSGTAIDFTGIPSWAKRIVVMFSGVSTNGISGFLVQIGSGSVTTSGYQSGSGGAATASNTTIGYNATTGFIMANNYAAGANSGTMTLSLLGSNKWVESHGSYTVGGAFTFMYSGGGASSDIGGTLDRVRITTVNGTDTFDAGSINIQYEG